LMIVYLNKSLIFKNMTLGKDITIMLS
jgi:hypothetical protein